MKYYLPIFIFLTSLLPFQIAQAQSTGDAATTVVVSGSQITIIAQVELWGDGVYNDPALAGRWEQTIENIWNNGSDGVKYKCYDVKVDAIIKVSESTRRSSRGGTANYHQIWVPDVKTGDMANAYNSYGLYSGEGAASGEGTGANPSSEYAYGELDPETAQEYYEQYTPKELQNKGKGQTKAFVRSYVAIGGDAKKSATWGTIPNTVSNEVVAHEFGHLLGIDHDTAACSDNVMSPTSSSKISRTQLYPRYFRRMLDDITSLRCDWSVRSEITMDGSQQTYIPYAFTASNEFNLKEESAGYTIKAAEPTDLIYDNIEKMWADCYRIDWQPKNGQLTYQAELRYNTKDDLASGGRLILSPTLVQEPEEFFTGMTIGGTASCPFDVHVQNLEGVDQHLHILHHALTGESAQATPYQYPNTNSCIGSAEAAEEPLQEQYYQDTVVIDGATTDAKAEHFPMSMVDFGYQLNYNIVVKQATPQAQ